MQMGFVDIATQSLKQWVVFIITVFVERHDLLWKKADIQRGTKNEMDEVQ